jgi:bla regulator protein blaR1
MGQSLEDVFGGRTLVRTGVECRWVARLITGARLHEDVLIGVLSCVRLGATAPAILMAAFFAQGQSAPHKQFDVASIRTYNVHDGNFMVRPQQDGTFKAVGVTLKMLIMYAYNMKAFQVSGLPGWAGTDLWEITAKTEGLADPNRRADAQLRVQALLEERYQLKAHMERRTMPVYALVLANGSRAKLGTASGDDQPGICPCGRASLAPRRASMAMLADALSTYLWRIVIDRTGMKGYYAFKLEWTPLPNEYGPEALGLPPETETGSRPDAANVGPTIFTALQEQLGLRLRSQKGPVTVVAIDRVAKPSEN